MEFTANTKKKIVTYCAYCVDIIVAKHIRGVLFLVQFLTGLWASIGVTHSYSSRPFLRTLVHMQLVLTTLVVSFSLAYLAHVKVFTLETAVPVREEEDSLVFSVYLTLSCSRLVPRLSPRLNAPCPNEKYFLSGRGE